MSYEDECTDWRESLFGLEAMLEARQISTGVCYGCEIGMHWVGTFRKGCRCRCHLPIQNVRVKDGLL